MRLKKRIIIFSLIILLLTISAANADENITADEVNSLSPNIDSPYNLYSDNALENNSEENLTRDLTDYSTEDSSENTTDDLTDYSTEDKFSENTLYDDISLVVGKYHYVDIVTWTITCPCTVTDTISSTIFDDFNGECVETNTNTFSALLPDTNIFQPTQKTSNNIGIRTSTYRYFEVDLTLQETNLFRKLNKNYSIYGYSEEQSTLQLTDLFAMSSENEIKLNKILHGIFVVNTIEYNLTGLDFTYNLSENMISKDCVWTIIKSTIIGREIFAKIMEMPSYAATQNSNFLEIDLSIYRNNKYLAYLNQSNYIDYNLSFQDTDYHENLHDLNNIELLISSDIYNYIFQDAIIEEIISQNNQEKIINISISNNPYNPIISEDNADYSLNTDKTKDTHLFSKPLNINNNISPNIYENIRYRSSYSSYEVTECEYVGPSLTKQFENYNFSLVHETNFIQENKEKDNQSTFIFNNQKINLPFNAINTSITALFGLIDITIPESIKGKA